MKIDEVGKKMEFIMQNNLRLCLKVLHDIQKLVVDVRLVRKLDFNLARRA